MQATYTIYNEELKIFLIAYVFPDRVYQSGTCFQPKVDFKIEDGFFKGANVADKFIDASEFYDFVLGKVKSLYVEGAYKFTQMEIEYSIIGSELKRIEVLLHNGEVLE